MENLEVKKWYQSSNFYVSVMLIIGGFFFGFPEGEARNLVGGIFATISSAGILRNFFKKGGKFNVDHFRDSNFWSQLSVAVIAIFPMIPADIFDSLQQVIDAAMGQNWQGLMIAAFSLVTSLYKIFKPKKVA